MTTSREPAIIKLGSTMPSLSTQRGDFEDWGLAGMAMRRGNVTIVDPHLASVVRENVWGVQFHPEFDVVVVKAYIRAHREELQEEDQNPVALLETCEPSPAGPEILRRFAQLIAQPGNSA